MDRLNLIDTSLFFLEEKPMYKLVIAAFALFVAFNTSASATNSQEQIWANTFKSMLDEGSGNVFIEESKNDGVYITCKATVYNFEQMTTRTSKITSNVDVNCTGVANELRLMGTGYNILESKPEKLEVVNLNGCKAVLGKQGEQDAILFTCGNVTKELKEQFLFYANKSFNFEGEFTIE